MLDYRILFKKPPEPMTPETKYKLISSIPFQVLALLFVISCIASDYYYRQQSSTGQYVIWGTFVSIVVGFLVYVRVKNK
jgi:hypothetical protein